MKWRKFVVLILWFSLASPVQAERAKNFSYLGYVGDKPAYMVVHGEMPWEKTGRYEESNASVWIDGKKISLEYQRDREDPSQLWVHLDERWGGKWFFQIVKGNYIVVGYRYLTKENKMLPCLFIEEMIGAEKILNILKEKPIHEAFTELWRYEVNRHDDDVLTPQERERLPFRAVYSPEDLTLAVKEISQGVQKPILFRGLVEDVKHGPQGKVLHMIDKRLQFVIGDVKDDIGPGDRVDIEGTNGEIIDKTGKSVYKGGTTPYGIRVLNVKKIVKLPRWGF